MFLKNTKMKIFYKISAAIILTSTLLPSCKILKCKNSKDSAEMKSLKSIHANAGCIILNEKNEILMAIKSNGQLTIPGGTSDKDENPMQTASRETLEEVGIKVKPNKLIKIYDNGYHLFLCQMKQKNKEINANHKFEKEIIGTKWVNIENENPKNLRYSEEYRLIPSILKKSEII